MRKNKYSGRLTRQETVSAAQEANSLGLTKQERRVYDYMRTANIILKLGEVAAALKTTPEKLRKTLDSLQIKLDKLAPAVETKAAPFNYKHGDIRQQPQGLPAVEINYDNYT